MMTTKQSSKGSFPVACDRVQVHYIPCRQPWYTKAHLKRGVTVKTRDLLSAAELSGAEIEGIQSLPVA